MSNKQLPVLFKFANFWGGFAACMVFFGTSLKLFFMAFFTQEELEVLNVVGLPSLIFTTGITVFFFTTTLESLAINPLRFFSKIPRVTSEDKRFSITSEMVSIGTLLYSVYILTEAVQKDINDIFFIFLVCMNTLACCTCFLIFFYKKKVRIYKKQTGSL